MFERFTATARLSVIAAQELAREMGASHIRVEHVLLAVLEEADDALTARLESVTVSAESIRTALRAHAEFGSEDAKALESIGIDLDAVLTHLDATVGAEALDRTGDRGRRHLPFDKAAKNALKSALKEAAAHRDREIGNEHVLLGALEQGASTIRSLLPEGVTVDRVRSAVLPARAS